MQQIAHRQAGFTITELLITLAIMSAIATLTANFFDQYQAMQARSLAQAEANESANISLGKIQAIFSNRSYDKDNPSDSGFNISKSGLVISIDNEKKDWSKIENQCVGYPNSLQSNSMFVGLKYLPNTPAPSSYESCLELLSCGPGTYPQVRITDSRNNTSMVMPRLDALSTAIQKTVIGQCVMAQQVNQELKLTIESVVYEPNNPNKTKILPRQRYLPLNNFANLQIIPND